MIYYKIRVKTDYEKKEMLLEYLSEQFPSLRWGFEDDELTCVQECQGSGEYPEEYDLDVYEDDVEIAMEEYCEEDFDWEVLSDWELY